MTPPHESDEGSARTLPWMVLVAACIGNALEFYGVTVYGLVAVTLAPLYFPGDRPGISMMMAFGVFGVSYLARPIGGVVLGAYSDRKGRRASLLLTLQIALAGSTILVFTPTYARIGSWAPFLVLVARILQGFAVGGELGSATAYLLEQAPKHRKPLFASLQLASQGLGGIFAATAGLLVFNLTPEHRATWGWRLMFAVPLLLAPVGIYIRRHLGESYEFLKAGPAQTSALRLLFQYRRVILIAAASIAALTANIYFRVYLPTFVSMSLGLPAWSTFVLMYITSSINMFLVPWVASHCTAANSKRIMMVSLLLLTLAIWPSIALVTGHATVSRLLFGCTLLSVLGAVYSAPQCFLIATLFPTHVRGAGVSACYNLGILAFGGFAPAVFSELVHVTGDTRSPAFYLLTACAVSLVAVFFFPKPETGTPLPARSLRRVNERRSSRALQARDIRRPAASHSAC
ncbi:MAG: transporter, family, proline/betaine transporter [Acidobacteriaceae bacterium]|nr:transporter, family, proline/betaine transporter [Acidobacteriaceae bacterium]